VRSNAQIRAQTRLVDRHVPSSQRGGQGFESPQLHRPQGKGPFPIPGEGLFWFVQQRCTAVGSSEAVQAVPELVQRVAGQLGRDVRVDLHRHRDLAVPEDLHGHARVDVQGGQQ